MASIVASLPPPLLLPARKYHPGNFPSSPFSLLSGRRNHVSFVVKASGESSESSTTLTVFKSVQNVAIDKLPVFPTVLELIGIFYSVWFTYRYLIFKPDREELFQILNKSASDILGQ